MAATFLTGFCQANTDDFQNSFLARITYYTDKRTAKGVKPAQGVTVAAERAFKFGTKFYIPDLIGKVGGNGIFVKHDVGPHVESRKASHGKMPVIDVFVSSSSKVKLLKAHKDNIFRVYRFK